MFPRRQIWTIVSLVTVVCFGAFFYSIWTHFRHDRTSKQFVGTWTPVFYMRTPPKTKLEIRVDNTYTFEHETHSWHLDGDKIVLEKFSKQDCRLELIYPNFLTDYVYDGISFERK